MVRKVSNAALKPTKAAKYPSVLWVYKCIFAPSIVKVGNLSVVPPIRFITPRGSAELKLPWKNPLLVLSFLMFFVRITIEQIWFHVKYLPSTTSNLSVGVAEIV